MASQSTNYHMRGALLVLAVGLAGCGSASHFSDSPRTPSYSWISVSPYPHLKQKIDTLLPDSLFPPAHIGMKIVSLSQNEVLYSLQPEFLFHPASNQKLFTSAAALSLLGRDYEFQTMVFIDSLTEPKIIIRGSGDPLLTTNDLDSMASFLAQHLPSKTSWNLIGDATLFDDVPWGKGWMWDDEPDPDAVFISALSVNKNCIGIRVEPGLSTNQPVSVATVPRTSFVTIHNEGVTTEARSDSLFISRTSRDGENLISVGGTISILDSVHIEELSIRNPEEFFLNLLAERLTNQGMVVVTKGLAKVGELGQPSMVLSRPLRDVIISLNKESDNLCAEVLLKTLGGEMMGTPGTSENGALALSRFLAQIGIDTSDVVIADGSGVSRYNLTTSSAIVEVLKAMYAEPWHFDLFYDSLPIAGVDGTLLERMKGTTAEGNLRAKTGTLSGVSSLSGYVRTADNELLAFSIVMENFPSGAKDYREVQDKIGVLLSNLRRGSVPDRDKVFSGE